MLKLSKGRTISAPRKVPKEAEHGSLTIVESYPTAPNKGLPVALSRSLTVHPHHQAWELQFQECHSIKESHTCQKDEKAMVMSGWCTTWEKKKKKQD